MEEGILINHAANKFLTYKIVGGFPQKHDKWGNEQRK